MSGEKKRTDGHGWTFFLLAAAAIVVLFNPATGRTRAPTLLSHFTQVDQPARTAELVLDHVTGTLITS